MYPLTPTLAPRRNQRTPSFNISRTPLDRSTFRRRPPHPAPQPTAPRTYTGRRASQNATKSSARYAVAWVVLCACGRHSRRAASSTHVSKSTRTVESVQFLEDRHSKDRSSRCRSLSLGLVLLFTAMETGGCAARRLPQLAPARFLLECSTD